MRRKYFRGFITNKSVKKLKNTYHLDADCCCELPCNCGKLDPCRFDYGIHDKHNSYVSSYCTHCNERCLSPWNDYTPNKSTFKGKGSNKLDVITKKTFKNYRFIALW